MLEILSPGMQNTEESDLSAEMFGVGRDLQQRCGTGVEQKIVDDFLVVSAPARRVRAGW